MIRRVTIDAPAKLNLGLEVIGRRPDGFHEIVTIFQAISIIDTLELAPAPNLAVASSDPTLASESNLVSRALSELRQASGSVQGAHVELTKRIPVAAGLGGASSDAAAALRAGRLLWKSPLNDEELRLVAGRLGSDVPFFLDSGTALGTGRGDEISPLPPLTNVWFVVVSPRIVIPRKTPTLYAALRSGDFSAGTEVHDLAASHDVLRTGERALPPNAFARALYALQPDLAALPEQMRAVGAPAVALSGAGPSHYAICSEPEQAHQIAARLRAELGHRAEVQVAVPVVKPPPPVPTYHE